MSDLNKGIAFCLSWGEKQLPEFPIEQITSTNMEPIKYVADVNKFGCKTIIVTAFSPEEALAKLEEEWGAENIIIPPQLPVSQEQIDAIEAAVWH
jgi:hypothetical protein